MPYTISELQEEARAVLNRCREGGIWYCTWVGDMAEQREAAERALEGDTVDLEMMLDMHNARLWARPEYEWDDWIANWQPTASESTCPMVAA